MDISILICTYNRAESLRATLDGFTRIAVPAGVDWELLVVDNNSKDHTAAVCREFAGSLPFRRIEEKRQGLSVARNRGISESRGSILAFTDDDVDVDPAWMAELWRAAGAYPEAAFFGGKIVPLWKESPPPWMVEYSSGMLSGVTMDFNLGQEERLLEKNELFFGANMAFRREMVLKMGLFRVDLGVNGNSLLSNEETEYMERLIEAGYRGLYVPRMVVHHRNPNDRMTESYMLRWFTGCGASHVRLGKVESSPFQLFGAPRYLWRQLAASACTYLARRWNPAAGATWVPSARYMAMVWGSISEFRRMARDRKKS